MEYLDNCIKLWLSGLNSSDNSRETYRRVLVSVNKWMHLNRYYSIMGATTEDLRAYREYLIKERSPYTVCNYITVIRMFYRYLHDKGKKETNPAAQLKGMKRSKYYNKLPLSNEQSYRLLKSIDTTTEKGKRDRVIILLMLHAGLRCCEVARLNVADIVETEGRKSLILQRKGHRAKDERIPIRRDIVEALDDYSTLRKWEPEEPIIISCQCKKRDSNNPPRQMTAHAIERIVSKILLAAGIKGEKITPHSLRHTFACMLVEKGVEMHKIQRLLGHVSSQITATYTKMQDERAIFENNPADLLDDF